MSGKARKTNGQLKTSKLQEQILMLSGGDSINHISEKVYQRKVKEADAGDPRAQLMVAKIAFDGTEGAPIEPEIALKYFLKVEANPNSTPRAIAIARRCLGQCYYNIHAMCKLEGY